MKDEFKGKTISEFVALQSKMLNGGEIKKAKGINTYFVKNIRHLLLKA